MKYKNILVCLCALMLLLSLVGCSIHKDIQITYHQKYPITDPEITKHDNLTWSSDNEAIATVDNGIIYGNGPGHTTIIAWDGNNSIAEYNVTVNTIPITNIVFSSNSLELCEGESADVMYSLIPSNASDCGVVWQSSNSDIVNVDETGFVTANKEGIATISAYTDNGITAECTINVIKKPAYERLSDKEKAFVDCVLKNIDQFHNPNSVIIKAVEKDGNSWKVSVSAQNGFGGNSTTVYYLSPSLGFWDWDSLDIDIDISPDSSYNISLINQAISDSYK